MTRQRTCGRRTPAAGRTPYCSICAFIDQKLADEEYEAAIEVIESRLARLTPTRTLYRRRHRYW